MKPTGTDVFPRSAVTSLDINVPTTILNMSHPIKPLKGSKNTKQRPLLASLHDLFAISLVLLMSERRQKAISIFHKQNAGLDGGKPLSGPAGESRSMDGSANPDPHRIMLLPISPSGGLIQ